MTATAIETPADGTPTGRTRATLLWVLGVACALVIIVLLAWFGPSAPSQEPFAPDNPEDRGARAAAQILQEQGVQVSYVRTTSAALASAREEGTLLIVNPQELRPEQQEALADAPGEVVLAGVGRDLDDLTDRVGFEPGGARGTHAAGCTDPHARAAGEIVAGAPQLRAEDSGAQVCFGDETGTGRYASWTQDGVPWRVLSTPELLTNQTLAEAGNAALVLRSLGQQPHLTWYVPDPADDYGIVEDAATTMPLLRGPVLTFLAVLATAVMFWRGRRLGPVVKEPLPVVVRATETTRGRGRLYRRHRTHAHAGAALRAGTVARMSGRLGLARWSGRDDVVQAISGATGRPPEQIDSVLYGPSPHDDASLTALAQALHMMESEVHPR
ncbi:MAG TPA: DUF4350 domain-containing protein [Beutenbergiaceae bacterium]|nr:DUF4350 domain-containing protein [Beutenbergiaceae bacterium]